MAGPLLALVLSAPLVAQGLGSPGRLLQAEPGVEPEPTELTGTLSGVAVGDESCEIESEAGIVALSGTLIQALGESGSNVTVVDPNGAYQMTLAEGTYLVEASTAEGHSAVVQVDILAGSSVHVSFTFDPRDETLLPSRGSMLLADGDPNPDTDRNGIVDFVDRSYVRDNMGGDPADVAADITGDLDGDGDIDLVDLQIVRAAFGRSVLHLASHYQAEVTPGGSTATLGNGIATVTSGEGYTLGHLEPTEDPSVARFVIEEDRGTATSPELGDFEFFENPGDPSYILLDLDTGRVLDGRMTLNLEGGPFNGTYPVDSIVEDGIVTMDGGGFERYQLVPVEGTLSSFPGLGTVAFAMCKKEKKKKNKACATVAKACGVECAVNATCAKNGKCGTCFTSRVGFYDRNGRLWITSCSCSCV